MLQQSATRGQLRCSSYTFKMLSRVQLPFIVKADLVSKHSSLEHFSADSRHLFIYNTTRESLFLMQPNTTSGLRPRGKRLGGESNCFLCDVGFELRGASLWWCETMKVWGKSHYPWQHTFESELWILLSLRDSEHSLQCKSSAVFLWCVGAFQSRKHYFRHAGLRSARNERLCNQIEGFIGNAHKTTA